MFGRDMCNVAVRLSSITTKEILCTISNPMRSGVMKSFPAIKWLKYFSCSDFNCTVFGSMAYINWMALFNFSTCSCQTTTLWRETTNLKLQRKLIPIVHNSCLLIGPVYNQPDKSVGEILDRALKGDENQVNLYRKAIGWLGFCQFFAKAQAQKDSVYVNITS